MDAARRRGGPRGGAGAGAYDQLVDALEEHRHEEVRELRDRADRADRAAGAGAGPGGDLLLVGKGGPEDVKVGRAAGAGAARSGWWPVACCALIVAGLFAYHAQAGAAKETEMQRSIHVYEEAIYAKKVQIYKDQFKTKAKEALVLSEENKRLAGELTKANGQIELANSELGRANGLIEDEAGAINEWKLKVDALKADTHALAQELAKERNETVHLQKEVALLTAYARRKDEALEKVISTLDNAGMKAKFEGFLG